MKITDVCRYPVRSLTAETLSKIGLKPSLAIFKRPAFRTFTELNSTPLTSATADWIPKSAFLCLMHNEQLAALTARFDDTTYILTIFRRGKLTARGRLADNTRRISIEEFFAAYIGEESKGWPRIVEAAGHHVLSVHKPPVLSILQTWHLSKTWCA